jgi:hypothetical protein
MYGWNMGIGAIGMDYGLTNVFEFWEYEITCLDRGTNSGYLLCYYDLEIKTGIIRLPILGQ